MKKFSILITFLIALSFSIKLRAQKINEIIFKINNDSTYFPNPNELIILKINFDTFYNEIQKNNSKHTTKLIMSNILYEVTINDTLYVNRKKAVIFFSKALKSVDNYERANSINYLISYRFRDFDKEALENIKGIFNNDYLKYQNDQLIKLVGFLKLIELSTYIKNTSNIQNKIYKPEDKEWAIILALARMGDKDAQNICLYEIGNRINVKNNSTRILEDAYYIRTQKSLDLLIMILNSNEVVSDISKPSVKNPVAYMARQYLIKMISNIPLSFKKAPFTNSQLQLERDWIKKYRNQIIINNELY